VPLAKALGHLPVPVGPAIDLFGRVADSQRRRPHRQNSGGMRRSAASVRAQ
jgi:hypothetical protein